MPCALLASHCCSLLIENTQGVLAPADALLALRNGAAGVIVSNHGGRQLDHSPAALDMLPHVVAAVRGARSPNRTAPVWVDGGVRRGTDVVKALALGADAVLLGRPVLYGLAAGGRAGAARVLALLRRELELAMALCGVARVEDIGPALLLVAAPAPVPLVPFDAQEADEQDVDGGEEGGGAKI